MIIGQSGSGKSASARNVALKWQSRGYDVVPVESLEQILEYRCKETHQIFVIDDVVGKYSVNGSYLYQLERLDSKLKALFNDSHAKLLCTLRKVVASDVKFTATNTILNDKAYIIDLDHKDNSLLYAEKMFILKNHLIRTNRQNDLSYEECTNCCNTNLAFPLLCRVFTTSDGLFQSKSDFFKKPLMYVNDEITKLHQRNKEVYCSLVICMIFSGKLRAEMFSVCDDSGEKQEKDERILGMISEACGLHRHTSRHILLDSVLSVKGIYIKNNLGKISFLHDSFLEAVSFHFSKVNLCVFLKCCNLEFLRERVRVLSPNVNDDQNIIILNEDSFGYLANRFIVELNNGDFIDILSSQAIKEKTFIKIMGNLIDSGQLVTKKKLMDTAISWSGFMQWQFCDPVYDIYKESVTAIMDIFPEDKTLIHWVVATNCQHFFDYFCEGMSKKQQKRYLNADKSFFSVALLSGCKEIIKTMLERDADVNSLESQYALQRLVTTSKNSALVIFVVNNAHDMNLIDYNGKSLLFYAIASKNTEIVKFFVETDARQNSLHEAVYNSNIQNAKDLFSRHNINEISNYGWSVFHFAAYNNDIAMMEMIFENEKSKNENENRQKLLNYNCIFLSIDKRDKLGWTPLHLASVLSNYEAVNFLIDKGANASLVDHDGKTPIHFSCNERITGSLLKHTDRVNELTFLENKKIPKTVFTFVDRSTSDCKQRIEDTTKDIVKTKKRRLTFEVVGSEEDKKCFYWNEVIHKNNIHFKKDTDKNWLPYRGDYPAYQGFMKEFPQNMKSWHPPLFSLIYVTCMNLLFMCSSIVKFRRNIDIPDKEGNTRLHAAAAMENQDESIACVKMLLKRGASPLLYNINGCMPSDVAFYKRSYKVKLLLDIYSMHTVKRGMAILVLVSTITVLMVVSLCLSAYYICPGYSNGDVSKNLNNADMCMLHSYSNSTLYSDAYLTLAKSYFSFLSGHIIAHCQHMHLHPYCFIHPLCVFCVLILNLFWSMTSKPRWRQKHFQSESIYYNYFHLTTPIQIISICFSNHAIEKILVKNIYNFFYTNIIFLLIDIFIIFQQCYHPEWLLFCSVPIQFILCCTVPVCTIFSYNPFSELLSKLSLISSMLESISDMSMIPFLYSFILTFIAIYVYINVLSCCAYLILLKMFGTFKEFRQYLYGLQIGMFMLVKHNHDCYLPRLNNPSFIWQSFFKATLIFILLLFETIVFYDSYHIC